MNAPATVTNRIREFVEAVAAHFEDLPERERAELLEDLEDHLLELAAEGDANLDAELASPAAYAQELRRTAGLPERQPTLADRFMRLVTWPLRRRGTEALLAFLPQLRPAWWVVRGWIAVTALAFLLGGGNLWDHVPVPGAHPAGLLLAAVAAVVSVRAGQAGADRTRIGIAADLVLGVLAAVVALGLLATPGVRYVALEDEYPWEPNVLRHPDGEPITNLYLFDTEGNPIEDVLVYDASGRPVEVGDLDHGVFHDLDSTVRRDSVGNPVRHMYPLEQYQVDHTASGVVRRPRPLPMVPIPEFGAAEAQPGEGDVDGRR